MKRFLLAAASALALPPAPPGPTMSRPTRPWRAGPFVSASAGVSTAPVGRLVAALRDPVLDQARRRRARRQHRHPRRGRPARQGPRLAARSARRPPARRRASAPAPIWPLPDSQRRPGAAARLAVDAGLDVSYEVDLFGRVSRGVEAARGDVGAAEADADAVRVIVVAETARAYADAVSVRRRGWRRAAHRRLLDQSLT
jgi:outer membrane protein TolC